MTEIKKSRSELKREAIITAAKQTFQELGVQNTSMDKLASVANVSKRTIYNHFESKETLVMALLSELWQSALSNQDDLHLAEHDLETQLIQLLRAEINVLTAPTYLELAKVAFGHFLYQPDALAIQMEKVASQETALYQWLKEKSSENQLKINDVERASGQLHSLIKGSCFWPQIIGIKKPLTETDALSLASSTAAFFLSHYQVK